MRSEQKTVQCAVESAAKARRLFEQILPPSLVPPHYFESVIHNGVFKWAVLAGQEVLIVPFNAADEKKIIRIKLNSVKSLVQDHTSQIAFADEELSKRTSKVSVSFLDNAGSDSGAGSTSPTRRNFLRSVSETLVSSPSHSPSRRPRNRSIFGNGGKDSPTLDATMSEEAFYTHEEDSKIYFYLQEMWVGSLTCHLYGWKGGRSEAKESRVRELYLELYQEITAATTLQERVDLVDELTNSIHLSMHLKRCVLLQTPSLISWLVAEIRKFSLGSWAAQPEMEGLGRKEAIQYVTALLEMLHRTLFQAWPLFSAHKQGIEDLNHFLEPRGTMEQIVAALLVPMVDVEEIKGKDARAGVEVMNMVIASFTQAALLYQQAAIQNGAAALGSRAPLPNLICRLCQPASSAAAAAAAAAAGPQSPGLRPANGPTTLKKWMSLLANSFKYVVLEWETGPTRTITLFHYTQLKLLLCQNAGEVRSALKANDMGEFYSVIPGLGSPVAGDEDGAVHPMEERVWQHMDRLVSLLSSDEVPIIALTRPDRAGR